MATRRYSVARGENKTAVVSAVGAATVTKSMEFTYDLAANNTKQDVLNGLKAIEQAIIEARFPPA